MSAPDTSGRAPVRWFLVFHEEGTVQGVSSTGEPSEIGPWLLALDELDDTWQLEDGVLRFSCTGPKGKVEYVGEVLPAALELEWHSGINDGRGRRSYELVTFATPDPGPR